MMLKLIYEDGDILVCRKPAGLPVQTRETGRPDLVSELKNYLCKQAGAEPYLGIVHRLDQPVEGILVFAKTRKAAAGLSAQASDGSMEKLYYAVTSGTPPVEQGILTDYLLKDGRSNTSSVVRAGTAGAKKAQLSYRTLEMNNGRALLEIKLLSGRHHQIRAQMARAGAPLAGDRKYGVKDPGGYEGGLALCACEIGFRHPVTHKKMTFTCRPEAEAFLEFAIFDEKMN